ncbi:MAG: CvpA family protein, partial [Bacilli bacterium]|nr:CvpA family protein [Bacilli bacterium]
ILKIFAKMVTSIPVIKQIDKGLGVIFGLIKVAAVVYILLFLLALLLTVPAINDLIGDFLAIDMQLNTDEFRVSKWLYNNNILQHIIDVFI